jgi:hypothetical protein
MDIAALSIIKSQSSLSQQVSLAVTKKVMDVSTNNSQDLIKMMELSANPNLGSKLVVKV